MFDLHRAKKKIEAKKKKNALKTSTDYFFSFRLFALATAMRNVFEAKRFSQLKHNTKNKSKKQKQKQTN